MSGVVSAAALLEETEEPTSLQFKADDLTYDLGMLLADDHHPVEADALSADKEGYLQNLAQQNTQLLIKHIFELQIEQTQFGPVAVLPDATTRLPRQKPVPKPKPLTRWQKFALAKGITKKKKSRMVWDDSKKGEDGEQGAWAPRHGYGRANDKTDTPIYELKPGDDPKVDHFERLALEKKQRGLKNKINQVANLERADRDKNAKAGLTLDAASHKALMAAPSSSVMGPDGRGVMSKKADRKAAKMAAKAGRKGGAQAGSAAAGGLGRPVGIAPVPIAEGKVDGVIGQGKGARMHAREDAGTKANRLALAQISTASMGRFDRQREGEPERPKDPRKLKRMPNELGAKDESKRNSDVLKRVLGGSGEGENSGAAARQEKLPAVGKKRKERPEDLGASSHKFKKERGKEIKRGKEAKMKGKFKGGKK